MSYRSQSQKDITYFHEIGSYHSCYDDNVLLARSTLNYRSLRTSLATGAEASSDEYAVSSFTFNLPGKKTDLAKFILP